MSLTLGIDIDGVVADFQGHWSRLYSEWFGVSVDPKQLDTWDSWKNVTHFATEAELWDWVAHVPQFWETMPTVPGAMGALYDFITKYNHRLHFITTRNPVNRNSTIEWLKRNTPSTNVVPEVHFTRAKGTIDVQVYIDDSPEVVESLRDKPCVILFDQPWNRAVETGGSVYRNRGWDEVKTFLHRLEHPSPGVTVEEGNDWNEESK